MSHQFHRRLACAALALAAFGTGTLAAQDSGGKKIYCWTEGGRKVCGDALPASAADSARTEISVKSGMTTARVDRALTDSERSAARTAAEDARRQAEAEAMRMRRDLAMVESYMTEADLRRAYGDRTTLLDETLKASRMGQESLRMSLLSLLRQAGDQELTGTPVQKRLADSIIHQHDELLRQRQILAAQEQDRATLERELEESVRRYREMKQPGSTQAPAKPAAAPAG